MEPYINFNRDRYRDRKRKILKRILFFILFIFLVTIGIGIVVKNKKEVVVKNLEKGMFINITDEISEPFNQINWQEVAAVIATQNKGDLSSVSESDVKNMSKKFIEIENSESKLLSLDEIMDNLQFKDKEKEQTKKFISQISKTYTTTGDTHKEFVNEIKVGAIETYKTYKILPSITIAQAILETGWGKSELTTKANNYFGIKADKSWTGKKINMDTKEYNDKTIKDDFRQYDNRIDSFKDHGKFLSINERYQKAGLFISGHYIEQATALQKAGYSTVEDEFGNKTYGKLLVDIIKDNNLMTIDNEAQRDE